MAVAAAAVTGGPLPLAFLSLSSLSFSFCFLSVRPLFLFLSFPKSPLPFAPMFGLRECRGHH